MEFNRVWSMPNKHTFSILPINSLIKKVVSFHKEFKDNLVIVDPFSGPIKYGWGGFSNDLDPECDTTHHLDAIDFLKLFDNESVDIVLYDPPYSTRQVSECYKKFNMTVNAETTRSSYWTYFKAEIARIMIPGGSVISCGWNSGGIGKKLGFKITEILLVPHGGVHNDTIVVVEYKQECN
jgi:hypothetical protein